MSEWFKDWFDTKYYHVLYKDRDHKEAEAFIRQLIDYLNIDQDAKVLDLACGRGRHSFFLQQQGFDTIGADLSKESIQFAKKYESEKLKFIQHDMREPIVQQEFDVVMNLFTSFGYFDTMDDNKKVLRSIQSYLKKEGDLIIDFLNAVKIGNHLADRETKHIEGIEFSISKEIRDNQIVKSIEFEDQNEAYHYQEKVQALTLNDFREILSAEGYEIVNVFGDYHLQEFSEEDSDRLIIHAKLTV